MLLYELHHLKDKDYKHTLELRKNSDGGFVFLYREHKLSSGYLKRVKRFYVDNEMLELLKQELQK